MRQLFNYSIFVLLTAVFLTGCSIQKNPVSGNKRAFGYSWSQEVQIGKDADKEITEQFGLYNDEEISTYVVDIGEKVLAESHMRRPETDPQFKETEFFFRVLDSPVINAFALPGGYVYMTRGLMAHLNNEAQFAVVMGHEIGHVAARHASQRALRQTVGQVAVIGGSVLGQEVLGLPGGTLLDLSSSAAQLLFLRYSRDNERESDELGVEYAAMNQYVASEGAALFTSLKRISENEQQSIPNLLSTHPDPGEREITIPQLAEEWRNRGYDQDIMNHDRYMELIDGMTFGENPREGFGRDGVFYHPELAFQFSIPAEWSLINQRAQVVLLSPDEDAVSIFRIDSESSTPQQSVQEITSQEEVDVIDEFQTESSNEWEAYVATAHASLEDGTPVTLHIYAVAYEERIYRFISYTNRDSYSSYEENFQEITGSFDHLTDSSILNIQPVRIRAFKAESSGSFSSFLPETLPMEITPMEVAILNQVELDEQIQQGQWLKIPVQ